MVSADIFLLQLYFMKIYLVIATNVTGSISYVKIITFQNWLFLAFFDGGLVKGLILYFRFITNIFKCLFIYKYILTHTTILCQLWEQNSYKPSLDLYEALLKKKHHVGFTFSEILRSTQSDLHSFTFIMVSKKVYN